MRTDPDLMIFLVRLIEVSPAFFFTNSRSDIDFSALNLIFQNGAAKVVIILSMHTIDGPNNQVFA